MRHELKCIEHYFQAVIDGRKNFEIRKNDRGYNAGDQVVLKEIKQPNGLTVFTGRTASFVIGYVTGFEQQSGYVVFSLLPRMPRHAMPVKCPACETIYAPDTEKCECKPTGATHER